MMILAFTFIRFVQGDFVCKRLWMYVNVYWHCSNSRNINAVRRSVLYLVRCLLLICSHDASIQTLHLHHSAIYKLVCLFVILCSEAF